MACFEALALPEFFQEKLRTLKQAEVLKGNFNENFQNFDMTSKRDVPCMWTGMSEDDFGFFLNGFRFVAGLQFTFDFYLQVLGFSRRQWFIFQALG